MRKHSNSPLDVMQHAMTVVELLIALAVLGIVIIVAVPGSSLLVEQYRLRSVSSKLVDGLYLAKDEALRRASTVRICPSSDGRSCRTDGDWNTGWLVFSDGNADAMVQEIELLEAFTTPAGRVRIIASGAASAAAAFTANGLVRDNGAATGEFVICVGTTDPIARTIVVDADGWVFVESAGNSRCQAG